MTEPDEDAAELDKAKVVQGVALIADDEPTAVPQPSEEAFDRPATLVPTQRMSSLGRGVLPVATIMRRIIEETEAALLRAPAFVKTPSQQAAE